MLEHALAELFEEQAAENPPPTHASVPAAARQGRNRRRWRQAGLAASPFVAAVAVLAIAFGGIIPTGADGAHPAPTTPAVRAPRLFNPLRPYASPGWLPDGQSVSHFVAVYSRLEDQYVGPTGTPLTVYAGGVCELSSRSFTCARGPGAPGLSLPRIDIGRTIGDLSGHAAYWMFPWGPRIGALTWQYAAGGWAQVSAASLRDALRMARSVRFSTAAGPSAAFPFQLTGVPADWRVNSVSAPVEHGVRYASSFSVTAGPVDTTVGMNPGPRQVVTVQTGPEYGTSCTSYFGHAAYREQIINGNEVFVLLRAQAWNTGAVSGLCTVVDGVLVALTTEGRAGISAADLLAQHVRFLGPDPARWTTRPIG
jgi:hypothetical protein